MAWLHVHLVGLLVYSFPCSMFLHVWIKAAGQQVLESGVYGFQVSFCFQNQFDYHRFFALSYRF